jgi:glutamine cyclotransferase
LNNTQITENKTTTTLLDEKTKAEQVMNQEKELEDEDLATDDKNTTTELEDIQQAWNNATVTLKSGVKFQIIDRIPHDPDAFTQGLTYVNGKLFESTGLYGRSSVRILDPQTGEVQQMVNMKREYFGEGMTVYKDKLVQIVWKKAKGFVYDLNDLTASPIPYTYETTKFNEGWGITYDYDRDRLIVTDGSSNLIFWEPDCWQPEKQSHCAPKSDPLPVIRQNGQPAMELNEIEYWRGRVLANVWYSDVLLVINPETGQVEKEYGTCCCDEDESNGILQIHNDCNVFLS